MSAVEKELSIQVDRLDETYKLLSELTSRLNPILTNAKNGDCHSGKESAISTSSPLAEAIKNNNDKLDEIKSLIFYITERLDI